MEGNYKWGRVIGNGQRGYGLKLNPERLVSWFIYKDFREKEGRKLELKRK
jgi:hypothetical protein